MNFAALIYHRQAFLDGQWWLPLTAQLAHFNATHALANAVGAVLLWWWFRPGLRWPQQTALVLGSAVAVAGGVAWDVQCDIYAGASGALHGWAAGGALLGWLRPTGTSKALDLWLLVAVCGKLVFQHLAGGGGFIGSFPVYLPSHDAGALGGALIALLLHCRCRPSARHQDAA